jgi:peptidyl-prolyl cis-trans isomerase C
MRPSRAEVETYYRRCREEFRRPEQIEVVHIVRNVEGPEDEAGAMEAMQQAEAALVSGAPFAAVAERFSDCGGKAILGWIARGEMVKEFEEAVFTLRKGERTGIFRTPFGFHIAKVLQTKAAGHLSLDEVRPALARRLLIAGKDRAIHAVVEDALRRASIQVVGEGALAP